MNNTEMIPGFSLCLKKGWTEVTKYSVLIQTGVWKHKKYVSERAFDWFIKAKPWLSFEIDEVCWSSFGIWFIYPLMQIYVLLACSLTLQLILDKVQHVKLATTVCFHLCAI